MEPWGRLAKAKTSCHDFADAAPAFAPGSLPAPTPHHPTRPNCHLISKEPAAAIAGINDNVQPLKWLLWVHGMGHPINNEAPQVGRVRLQQRHLRGQYSYSWHHSRGLICGTPPHATPMSFGRAPSAAWAKGNANP